MSISVICKGILIHYLCLLEVYKAKLGTRTPLMQKRIYGPANLHTGVLKMISPPSADHGQEKA